MGESVNWPVLGFRPNQGPVFDRGLRSRHGEKPGNERTALEARWSGVMGGPWEGGSCPLGVGAGPHCAEGGQGGPYFCTALHAWAGRGGPWPLLRALSTPTLTPSPCPGLVLRDCVVHVVSDTGLLQAVRLGATDVVLKTHVRLGQAWADLVEPVVVRRNLTIRGPVLPQLEGRDIRDFYPGFS